MILLQIPNKKVKSFLPTDPFYEEGDYKFPVAVGADMYLYDENLLSWELCKPSEDRGIKESYVGASVQFWSKALNANKIPVFAFFSDSYPRFQPSIGKKMQAKLNSGNPLPRNTAYFKWDNESNCAELWRQFYIMNWKNIRFGNDKGNESFCKAIESVLIKFSEPISDNKNNPDFILDSLSVETRGNEDVLVLKYRNGRIIPFDMLPQGHKRVFSIVMDIANRGYFLQKDCNPHGVVFIDEVELHLHPSLAQEIVQRFRRSFSNIQFVVSTHSPLVIADYKQDDNNLLYNIAMSENGPEYQKVKNMYGMDYISVLHSVMGTPERDTYIQNLARTYRYWKQLGDKKRLHQLEGSLKRLVGEDSEFYKSLIG